jgi:hypothetical protein
MNASIDCRPTRYDVVEAHERTGAEANELDVDSLKEKSRGIRRLTMEQSVAAKWITRYACENVGAVSCKAVNVEAIRH